MSKVLVCGDVHGDWSRLFEGIEEHSPDMLLQCGDFGFWPGNVWEAFKARVDAGDLGNTRIYWCDGNHEHFDELFKLEGYDDDGKLEILPGVFYMSRGSILRLEDGRNVLFCGGAESIDRTLRVPGKSWFPQEVINQYAVDGLLTAIDKRLDGDTVEVVVSHTCPFSCRMLERDEGSGCYKAKLNDPTRFALDSVLQRYAPLRWYFGHWHRPKEGLCNRTKWVALDETRAPFEPHWITELGD